MSFVTSLHVFVCSFLANRLASSKIAKSYVHQSTVCTPPERIDCLGLSTQVPFKSFIFTRLTVPARLDTVPTRYYVLLLGRTLCPPYSLSEGRSVGHFAHRTRCLSVAQSDTFPPAVGVSLKLFPMRPLRFTVASSPSVKLSILLMLFEDHLALPVF